MQILVENIITHPSECPYAEWEPYPPIIEKTGIYVCKVNRVNKHTPECNLNTETKECSCFKQFKKDIEEPRLRGWWIPAPETIADCSYYCSQCGFFRDAYILDVNNFCPNCGAKMEKNEQY